MRSPFVSAGAGGGYLALAAACAPSDWQRAAEALDAASRVHQRCLAGMNGCNRADFHGMVALWVERVSTVSAGALNLHCA